MRNLGWELSAEDMGDDDSLTAPEIGTPMEPAHASIDARRLLALRRSTSAELLTEPGPDESELANMLQIAARVPDHRRVFPFRFVVMRGEARERAGEVLARVTRRDNAAAADARIDVERRRFSRAPLVVMVVARIDPGHRTPEWEQTLTVGATCQNLLLAASAFGFAATWLTEWCAFDADVLRAFGLAAEEKVAGFIYIGTASENPKERARPNMDEIVSNLTIET
ncbi:MAG: nitroreductase [Parvularculaceae bacterium]|nr:nitroreductase [Parvularculaceae bacterium]